MSERKRDITTMQVSPKIREAIKRKKRGDETYNDFFKRRLGL